MKRMMLVKDKDKTEVKEEESNLKLEYTEIVEKPKKDQRERGKGHLRKRNGSFLGLLSQRIYSYDLCGKHFP